MSAIDTFLEDLRQLGPVATVERSLYKLLRAATGTRVLVCMDFTEERLNRDLLTPDDGYACRLLREEELLHHADDPGIQLPGHFVRAALAKGDECFGVLCGDELVSFGWYAHSPTPVIGVLSASPADGWPYMYHGYTKPAHRGSRLHGNGLARALATYRERGMSGIVSFLELTNTRSERSALRVGFRTVGTVFAAKLGSRPFVWASPGCGPYVRVGPLAQEDAFSRALSA